jgi:hypothetical protein
LKTGTKKNQWGKNKSISQPAPYVGNENRELRTGKSTRLNQLEKTKPRIKSGEAEGRMNKNRGTGAEEPSQRA